MSSTKPPLQHPQLHLNQQLCFALYAASRAMTRLYQPLLAPLGVTYPQYLVLLCLWEEDGLSVSALGDRLALDSGTLTPLLRRLQSLQLIHRHRSTQDERRVFIHLTPQGQALQAQAANIPHCILQASQPCSMDELHRLMQQLNQLRGQWASGMASGEPEPT